MERTDNSFLENLPADKAAPRRRTMRLSVVISSQAQHHLAQLAQEQGRSINDLVRLAIEDRYGVIGPRIRRGRATRFPRPWRRHAE